MLVFESVKHRIGCHLVLLLLNRETRWRCGRSEGIRLGLFFGLLARVWMLHLLLGLRIANGLTWRSGVRSTTALSCCRWCFTSIMTLMMLGSIIVAIILMLMLEVFFGACVRLLSVVIWFAVRLLAWQKTIAIRSIVVCSWLGFRLGTFIETLLTTTHWYLSSWVTRLELVWRSRCWTLLMGLFWLAIFSLQCYLVLKRIGRNSCRIATSILLAMQRCGFGRGRENLVAVFYLSAFALLVRRGARWRHHTGTSVELRLKVVCQRVGGLREIGALCRSQEITHAWLLTFCSLNIMRLLFSKGVKLVLRRAQTSLFTAQATYTLSMVAYRCRLTTVAGLIMIVCCGGSVVQTYGVTVLSWVNQGRLVTFDWCRCRRLRDVVTLQWLLVDRETRYGWGRIVGAARGGWIRCCLVAVSRNYLRASWSLLAIWHHWL